MTVTVGVPRETFPGERRVALTPRACEALIKAKLGVLVEFSAGLEAGFPGRRVCAARRAAGFARGSVRRRRYHCAGANAGAQIRNLAAPICRCCRRGQILIGFGDPLTALRRERGSGRSGRFVLCDGTGSAHHAGAGDGRAFFAWPASRVMKRCCSRRAALPKMFPMMMTAAGTITPAKVLVLGAGVAGLQAIATARRLGAVVSAYDVRAAVKEQIESLGAKFVVLDMDAARRRTGRLCESDGRGFLQAAARTAGRGSAASRMW